MAGTDTNVTPVIGAHTIAAATISHDILRLPEKKVALSALRDAKWVNRLIAAI